MDSGGVEEGGKLGYGDSLRLRRYLSVGRSGGCCISSMTLQVIYEDCLGVCDQIRVASALLADATRARGGGMWETRVSMEYRFHALGGDREARHYHIWVISPTLWADTYQIRVRRAMWS